VYEIRRSKAFDAWLTNLKDSNARARIAARIDRLSFGNPGEVKPVGSGVSEMRIDYGPGYRVYYARTELRTCCCAVALRLRRTQLSNLLST